MAPIVLTISKPPKQRIIVVGSGVLPCLFLKFLTASAKTSYLCLIPGESSPAPAPTHSSSSMLPNRLIHTLEGDVFAMPISPRHIILQPLSATHLSTISQPMFMACSNCSSVMASSYLKLAVPLAILRLIISLYSVRSWSTPVSTR